MFKGTSFPLMRRLRAAGGVSAGHKLRLNRILIPGAAARLCGTQPRKE